MPRFGHDFLSEVLSSAKTPIGQFMGEEGGGKIQGVIPTGGGGFFPTAMPGFGGQGSFGYSPQGMIPTGGSGFGGGDHGFGAMMQAVREARTEAAQKAAATAAAQAKKDKAARDAVAPPTARDDYRTRPGTTPTATGAIDNSSREAFLRTAMPYFQQIEAQTGIPAEAMAAIAINEGATDPGTLAHSSGAPFGIKSVGQDAQGNDVHTGYPVSRVNAWEVIGGRDTRQPSAFINFPDPATAIQGFVDFLQRNPRYAAAVQAAGRGTNPQEFISLLHQAGYATDPAWTTKTTSIANEAARYRQQFQQLPEGALRTALEGDTLPEIPGQENRGAIRGVNQNDYARAAGLDRSTAAAICGPAAVDAFVRQNGGRSPSLTEAFDIASRNGFWSQSVGMYGPNATKAVIERMGVPAEIVPARTPTLAREVTLGHLAIVNTRGHYYQAIGYDPETDRFQWGDAVGNGRWARLDQISNWGYGSPDVAIIAAPQ